MTKREWENFKKGFKEPAVRRKSMLLIALIILFIINLIWFQHTRNERNKEIEEGTATVYTQGVLGVCP